MLNSIKLKKFILFIILLLILIINVLYLNGFSPMSLFIRYFSSMLPIIFFTLIGVVLIFYIVHLLFNKWIVKHLYVKVIFVHIYRIAFFLSNGILPLQMESYLVVEELVFIPIFVLGVLIISIYYYCSYCDGDSASDDAEPECCSGDGSKDYLYLLFRISAYAVGYFLICKFIGSFTPFDLPIAGTSGCSDMPSQPLESGNSNIGIQNNSNASHMDNSVLEERSSRVHFNMSSNDSISSSNISSSQRLELIRATLDGLDNKLLRGDYIYDLPFPSGKVDDNVSQDDYKESLNIALEMFRVLTDEMSSYERIAYGYGYVFDIECYQIKYNCKYVVDSHEFASCLKLAYADFK